jgi:signal transduction histidine kinase/CHASE3 domain sensor protein
MHPFRGAVRERAIIGAYVLALVTFAVVAIVVFLHFERFGDQSRWVQHTHQVLTGLEEGLGQLKDVETGQRGYLLAGQEDFLQPYHGAVEVVREQFDRLAAITQDNPRQQEQLHALRPLIERKIAFSDHTIDVFRRGDPAAAHALVAAREGKALMDQIRRRIDEMEDEERRLLGLRIQRAETAAWRTTVLIVFGNAFAFTLLATGTLLLGRELNRRKRLEEELAFREERDTLRSTAEQAQRRLAAVIDELPIGVVLAEAPGGSIVEHNARMRDLRGGALPRAERGGATHLPMRRADGSPYPAGGDPLSRAAARGDGVRGEELQLERADGSVLPVIADTAPVRERDGRVVAAVGVFQDYAELRRSEEQRQHAERFRDVFLRALGHELRNPLSVITAGASSLSRRVTSEGDIRIVHRMMSSAHRMARMVAQLIDLAQARLGGGLAIERQRMDLGEATRHALERIEVVHPDRTIERVVEGELVGNWDPERVGEILSNLIENALAHGRPDGPVRVAVRRRGDEVVLEVHNWGNPIPAGMMPLVFDPFRRAAEKKRMKSAGLGIGLYLALQVARAHGGTIDVESSAEQGTRFRVVLPVTHA